MNQTQRHYQPENVVKTPTQPQHNLTQPEVGLDTIIGLHNFAPAAARPHQELYFYLKE